MKFRICETKKLEHIHFTIQVRGWFGWKTYTGRYSPLINDSENPRGPYYVVEFPKEFKTRREAGNAMMRLKEILLDKDYMKTVEIIKI